MIRYAAPRITGPGGVAQSGVAGRSLQAWQLGSVQRSSSQVLQAGQKVASYAAQ